MYSTHTTLYLLSLFSQCVVDALPTRPQRQTFTVTRKHDLAGPFDGVAERRHALLKHGIPLPAYLERRQTPSATAAAPAGTETSSVVAESEANDLEYLSRVDVGGVSMNLDFDTGSSDL
jgi:hypothetical protein